MSAPNHASDRSPDQTSGDQPSGGRSSGRRSSWRRVKIGLTIAATVMFALAAPAYFRGHRKPSTPVVSSAALAMNFKLLDGQTLKLSQYSGKVLLVDLWATWCSPCRQEIPHLIEIVNEYRHKGVEVVGLTTEDPDSEEQTVRNFILKYKINYPIGWADSRLKDGLMNGREGIPQTIIFSRTGKVIKYFVGFNSRTSPPQIRAALDAALAEGS